MYQVIFVVAAVLLTALCLGVLAWALLLRRDKQETQDNAVASLQVEYRHLCERKADGTISAEVFAQEESDLAQRVLSVRDGLREQAPAAQKWLNQAALVLCVVAIPLVCVTLYLWHGDFSALSKEAVEQIQFTKTAAQSQKSMADTIAQLEQTVRNSKDKDNLDAWDILADYYYNNNDLHKAEEAYRNVLRLNAASVPALANLADILVALNQGEITPEVEDFTQRALVLDPWQDKSLLLGGIIAFQKGDYTHAVMYWNRLKNMTAQGNDLYEVLETNIAAAMKAGGLKELPHDENAQRPAKMGGAMGMPGMGAMGGMGQKGAMPPQR